MTNPVIDAIKQRRSIREFTDKTIDKEILHEIIQAGRYAPSATNDQPWRFIIITNENKIKELSTLIQKQIMLILKWRHFLKLFFKQLRSRDTLEVLFGVAMAPQDVIFFKAPALVLIVTKNKQFYDESCACCAQNMMLTAHTLGLGSCWIGFTNFLNRNKQVLQSLNIPEGYHITSALIFGYPKEKPGPAPIRKPMADVINWVE